jgi:hypothetical protein
MQVNEEMDRKKQQARDQAETANAIEEIHDVCYLLYDYFKKCEKCSYVAQSDKVSKLTICYVAVLDDGSLVQMADIMSMQ